MPKYNNGYTPGMLALTIEPLVLIILNKEK